MPPMSKTRRLPFKPPRQLSTAGEPSAPESGATSKSKSKKRRGSATQRDSTSAMASGSNTKKRRDSRAPSSGQASKEAASSPAASSSSQSPPPVRAASSAARDDDTSPEPDYMLAEVTTAPGADDEDIMTSEPKVPSKLVTALLHHHFQDDKTRVTKDATKVYAKYLEVFVREAVARAVYEKQEAMEADFVSTNRMQNVLEGYLEMEELEKLVPQLLMDF